MLRAWFDGLAPRERILVIAAGILTILALIFILGIRPLFSGSDLAQQRVADKESLLSEIDRLASRIGPQRGRSVSPTGNDRESLVVLIDRTTRAANLGLYVKRNQPDGDDKIRVRFENVPFDTLIEWLSLMSNQYGLSADSANIDASSDPGRVNCNLLLSRLAVPS